ncbi:MAG TPA: dTDP-glucose 4,6-dehydratase [Elusimicrobia bacterium]|nr:MAG: dTDP-glucose 4,6-dehydratase [Elusimicrobia bacterium RIFOXYA12_FULL_49_49]OGS16825.1 MAG: dTDP-glucose 4,6-dehydratase [Elusimicrobia bacterium RIFOXYA2_FULL_47_53]OGS32053.1 MAG: dTDP-glucose 4,6-dehydratase [Elusimicrobia bacterium RIFOXYB2_FULL_46_23]HBU69946.1 dTDP-glucose 4,6-dehydratase [Elusimicrobiota bacterium]
MKLLVTGGAGFIGSNFIRHILNKYKTYKIINLDKLTYAGNLDNLLDVASNRRYKFVKGDICDAKLVDKLVPQVDAIINFAAETHVDRSIMESGSFIKTDVFGTHTLLEAAKKHKTARYIQISTDEVYGSIQKGSFTEKSTLSPNSPYSSSKAGGDLLARSYFVTHKVPVLITRASNNFGPFQYPEKVIPLFVTNALEDKQLPLYGDGKNVRDWLYVTDHCKGVDLVLHKGKDGEIYNIGGGNEITNLELTSLILEYTGKGKELIKRVADRPGHDRRYSLNCAKIKRELGYAPSTNFKQLLKSTVDWYAANLWWWKKLKDRDFGSYYKKQYKI